MEEAEPREDDTAAAIYADYTSRLPQLDGNEELEENLNSISSSIDQLDGITDDIYSRYNERLEESKSDYIESLASHSNSYQDSSYSPWDVFQFGTTLYEDRGGRILAGRGGILRSCR